MKHGARGTRRRAVGMGVLALVLSDAHALLGDLLQRLDLEAPSRAQLTRALALDPACPLANEVQARVAQREGRPADARAALERAATSERASYLTHFQLALALDDEARLASGDAAREVRQRQEAALRRSLTLQPTFAEAHHRLAMVIAQDPARTGEAILAEQQALTLMPGRDAWIFGLARLRAQAGDVAAAKALARNAAARTQDETLRSQATRLAAELEAWQKHQARVAAVEQAHGLKVSDGGLTFAQTRPHQAPDFLRAGAGEQRAFGYLVSVECAPDATGFVLDVAGAPLRLRAADVATVKLIAFRDDLAGNLGCGRRSALDAVYVTWRPTPGDAANGTTVALEFVPRGYIPPQ